MLHQNPEGVNVKFSTIGFEDQGQQYLSQTDSDKVKWNDVILIQNDSKESQEKSFVYEEKIKKDSSS